MEDKIETVRVIRPDAPGGYVVINKEDLQPDDRIYGEHVQAPKRRSRGKGIAEHGASTKSPSNKR